MTVLMEGFLGVPPERNALLGKTGWKSRFVVLGTISEPPKPPKPPRPAPPSRAVSSSRLLLRRPCALPLQTGRGGTVLNIKEPLPHVIYLSIYKQMGDLDPIARYPLSSILHYTIDNVVHRKSGPTIPTLKLSFQVDTPPTTGSFRRKPSQPDLTPRYTTVLFRSVPDDGYTLYDWQQALQSNVFLTSSYHDFDYNYSFLTSGCSSPNFESQPPPPQSQSSFYSTTSLQSLSAVLDSSRSVHSSRSDVSSISSDHRSYFCSTPSVLPSPSFEVPLTPLSEGLNPLLELNPLLKKVSNGSIGMRKAMIIPKESILDRNLMTECIPDSTREAKPEMISLARYNAMMRDLELNQVVGGTPLMPIEYDKDDNMVEMPTPRALEFISSGRSTPGSMKETKPSIFHDSVPPAASHKSLVVDDAGVVPCVIKVNTKTRGLTQFKRRLSSTSSLLLVQT